MYEELSSADAFTSPLSWTDSTFSLNPYDLVFLPGGHEKSIRQIIEDVKVQEHLANYVPETRKPGRKSLAAICHGVQVLSAASNGEGKSVIHDLETTALPSRMEGLAFWGTRMMLGDYVGRYAVPDARSRVD